MLNYAKKIINNAKLRKELSKNRNKNFVMQKKIIMQKRRNKNFIIPKKVEWHKKNLESCKKNLEFSQNIIMKWGKKIEWLIYWFISFDTEILKKLLKFNFNSCILNKNQWIPFFFPFTLQKQKIPIPHRPTDPRDVDSRGPGSVPDPPTDGLHWRKC